MVEEAYHPAPRWILGVFVENEHTPIIGTSVPESVSDEGHECVVADVSRR
jgi:hypothetical protein